MRSGWRFCRSTGTLWMAFGLLCFLLSMYWADRFWDSDGLREEELDGRDRRDTRPRTDARPLAADGHCPASCADGVADGVGPGNLADACRDGDSLGDQFAGVGDGGAGDRGVVLRGAARG